MPSLPLPSLAPLGPGLVTPAWPSPTPARRTLDRLAVDRLLLDSLALDSLLVHRPALGGPLGNAVASGSLSLTRWRLAAWDELRRVFPRPGHAAAAAGLAVASATLASLGLLAAAAAAEATAAGAPAAELSPDATLAELAATDGPVAVVSPPPGPAEPGAENAPGETGAAGDHTHAPAISAPTPARATGVPGLRRIPSGADQPPPAAATPAPAPEPAGTSSLSRVSRSQLPAAPPPPSLVAPAPDQLTPVVPTDAGVLPLGKGMWLYVPEEIEGGSVDALVARARQVGLTHVYVRTGSSRGGFYAQPYMDELLPKAHAAGIRVYGWDFPYLDDVDADVARALAAITHTTPGGERLDGFAADIETASEGTNLSAEGAAAYGQRLRSAVGPAYPMVAVVPRPSANMQGRYPYAAVIPPFDAVAPMTYWLNRQPDTDVINDIGFLASFGKPVLPIGQAYDGGPEGGRPGPPPSEEIQRFLGAAHQVGAAGVSLWSWQHASQAIWDTLQAAPEFRWEPGLPGELRSGQVRALQGQLSRLGYPVAATGTWDETTTGALRSYQERARLPRSGVLDAPTLAMLLEPFNPPVGHVPGSAHP